MTQHAGSGLARSCSCVNLFSQASAAQLVSMDAQTKHNEGPMQPTSGEPARVQIGQEGMRGQGPSWREVGAAFKGQLAQAIESAACKGCEGLFKPSQPQTREEVVGCCSCLRAGTEIFIMEEEEQKDEDLGDQNPFPSTCEVQESWRPRLQAVNKEAPAAGLSSSLLHSSTALWHFKLPFYGCPSLWQSSLWPKLLIVTYLLFSSYWFHVCFVTVLILK